MPELFDTIYWRGQGPAFLAARMIKYRNLLGGYFNIDQLEEVYGLDSFYIAPRMGFIVIDTSLINKLNLNTSTFRELVRHPYISYDLARSISENRQSDGPYLSANEIVDRDSVFPVLFTRLRPYLTVE